MKTHLTLIIGLIFSINAIAQKPTITYQTPGDSTANYYLTVMPVEQPKGLLVLLPGFGGSPESEYAETNLPKEAARRGC